MNQDIKIDSSDIRNKMEEHYLATEKYHDTRFYNNIAMGILWFIMLIAVLCDAPSYVFFGLAIGFAITVLIAIKGFFDLKKLINLEKEIQDLIQKGVFDVKNV